MERFIDEFDVFKKIWISKDNSFILGNFDTKVTMVPTETISCIIVNKLADFTQPRLATIQFKKSDRPDDEWHINYFDVICGAQTSPHPTDKQKLEAELFLQRLFTMIKASRKKQDTPKNIKELEARLDRLDDLVSILANYVKPAQQ